MYEYSKTHESCRQQITFDVPQRFFVSSPVTAGNRDRRVSKVPLEGFYLGLRGFRQVPVLHILLLVEGVNIFSILIDKNETAIVHSMTVRTES